MAEVPSPAARDGSGGADAAAPGEPTPADGTYIEGVGDGASEPRSTSKSVDPLIGRTINDRFRIVDLVARGGMGKVYKAEQAPLGREVALKVLNPNYSGDSDPEFHKRFFLEASTCSKLSHPNTVTIFDYGRTDDDVYYIAMELLEGRTLHRALRDDGPFEPDRAMHVTRQICRSLREAHSLGVIHRDLKPANIFLVKHGDESDFVKVLDFGLVKELEGAGEDLTQTGLFMGSPKYMSPEQIKGEGVDSRADIYALGAILYEMLTGTVPFDRPNSVNILMAHVHDAPPPLTETNPDIQVSSALSDIVMKALAKDVSARFASMDELLAELKALAVDHGLSVTRSTELGMSGTTGPYAAVGEAGAGAGDFAAHASMQSSSGPLAHSGSFPPSGPLPGAIGPSSAAVLASLSQESMAVQTPSRAPYVMAAVGALALVIAVGVSLVMGGRESADDPAPLADPPEPVVVTDPDPTPPPPAVDTTLVRMRSEPSGASVTVGETEYGPTPTDVEWVGEDAARGRQVTFVFSLEGHQDYSVTRVVTGDELEVEASLEPAPAARPAGRGPRGGRGRGTAGRGGGAHGGSGGTGPVHGYKLDPY